MNIYLDGRLWRARARFVFLGECRVFEVWLLFWGNLSRSLRRPRASVRALSLFVPRGALPKKPVRGLRRRRLLV